MVGSPVSPDSATKAEVESSSLVGGTFSKQSCGVWDNLWGIFGFIASLLACMVDTVFCYVMITIRRQFLLNACLLYIGASTEMCSISILYY